MKHWQETGAILERLAELEAAGREAAVACVVRISGSAYRRPGARFLIAADGTTLGGISGGCLEEDVRQNALAVIESGTPRLLHYETGDDDESLWGLGLGCDGMVDVFVAPASGAGIGEQVERLRELLADGEPFVAITLLGPHDAVDGIGDAAGSEATPDRGDASKIRSDAAGAVISGRVLILDPGHELHGSSGDPDCDAALRAAADAALEEQTSRTVVAEGVDAFVEPFNPPSILIICGAGDDAMPMALRAAEVGFRVVVVDHRSAYLAEERFPSAWKRLEARPDDDVDLPTGPDTFVVLKTHNLARDKAWAQRFLATPTPYLGLLGPRARCEEIASLAADNDRRRIFGPVGVDLGAEGPEQVGMSVVAEALAVRNRRAPGHLKHREAPIHDHEPEPTPTNV